MPLLRLQQPCPRAESTRRAGPARCSPSSTIRPRWCPEREVVSIFFGGGTPSLMPPETVGGADRARARAVAGRARSRNHAGGQSELGRGRALRRRSRAAGVNRLSLGVQALDDGGAALSRPRPRARRGDRGDPRWRATHFARYSFDLIYARPGQTARRLATRSCDEALALAGEHLSLYQLTIEPGTAFGNRAARGEIAGGRRGHRRRAVRD